MAKASFSPVGNSLSTLPSQVVISVKGFGSETLAGLKPVVSRACQRSFYMSWETASWFLKPLFLILTAKGDAFSFGQFGLQGWSALQPLEPAQVLLVGIRDYAVGHLSALVTLLIIGAAVRVVSLIVHHHWLG